MNIIKLFSILLSLICLVESCTIYRKTPVTVEKATSDNTKVKVYTKDGTLYTLNTITLKDGQYYGVKRINGQTITQPLDLNNIETIKVKNKGASTFLTIAGCVSAITIIGIIIFMATFNPDEWFTWDSSKNQTNPGY